MVWWCIVLEVLSLFCEIAGEDGRRVRIAYKLLEERCGKTVRYGFRCFLPGDGYPPCTVRQVTADRTLAEAALARMAAGGVMPVHMEEIVFELLS